MAHEVFISYAHDEHAMANQVCAGLETQHHLRCWIAPCNTSPGSDWVASIGSVIARSRVLLLLLSAASDRSGYVKNEVLWARERHIPIVPLAIENVSTPGLGFLINHTQRLEAWTPPLAQHLPRLAAAIQALLSVRRTTALHIMLLARRQAEPDMRVVAALEQGLSAHGHQVFIDRQATAGLAWARDLEQRVRQADVVIPLLSAASVHDEIIAWMLEAAREVAYAQAGRPRLVPIRVQYAAALPEPLEHLLDPMQGHVHWSGPADTPQLTAEVLRALADPAALLLAPAPPAPEPPPGETPSLMPPGGAVPLNASVYIERPIDATMATALARRDSIVLLTGARQMGKTSLLVRGLQQARQAGHRVALIDFQQFNATHLTSAEALYHALGAMLADKLDLDTFPSQVWNPAFPPNYNFERYMRREILGKLQAHLVWGLDEVDRLFACDFRSEVFGLFRSWLNARSGDPTGPWSRLTLVLSYATEAHLFIANLDQSPFNVGTSLPPLADFTFAEVEALHQCYGSPLQHEAAVAQRLRLLGGQPYLTSRWLYDMQTQQRDFASMQEQAARDDGPFGDHLKRLLLLLSQDDTLSEAVRQVLRGRPCADLRSWQRLRSAGVLLGDTPEQARLRCELYATYLGRHLLREVPRL